MGFQMLAQAGLPVPIPTQTQHSSMPDRGSCTTGMVYLSKGQLPSLLKVSCSAHALPDEQAHVLETCTAAFPMYDSTELHNVTCQCIVSVLRHLCLLNI